jgi:hypothetical protein
MNGLTQARLKELLRYDCETGVFTRIQRRSSRALPGDAAGYKNNRGYVIISVDGKHYAAHRLAWLYVTASWPAVAIDHINLQKDDNRFVNLRPATSAENLRNKGLMSTNTSGATGVMWNERLKGWRAFATREGRRYYFGVHRDFEQAVAARQRGAQCVFGEFARSDRK